MNFEVEIKLMKGHEKGVLHYQREPVKRLIQLCDKEAEEARENARLKMSESNIKFYGCYSLKKGEIMQMRSIKEILRVIDAREEEKKQAQKKLGYKTDFIDLEARDSFKAHNIIISTIKCAHSYNYYGLRYVIINDNLIEVYYLRCNQVET